LNVELFIKTLITPEDQTRSEEGFIGRIFSRPVCTVATKLTKFEKIH